MELDKGGEGRDAADERSVPQLPLVSPPPPPPRDESAKSEWGTCLVEESPLHFGDHLLSVQVASVSVFHDLGHFEQFGTETKRTEKHPKWPFTLY